MRATPQDAPSARRPTPGAPLIVAAAILAACAGAATARAQNALGDGRALDSNQKKDAPKANPQGRDIAAEVLFRNALVVGDVAGGKQFRGSVGYTGPNDFAGVLGSDYTYPFLRDSLYSGLAGQGVRGVDALQQQMNLTTGNTGSALPFDIAVLRRPGAVVSAGDLAGRAADSGLGAPPALIDPSTLRLGALRSTSDYRVSRALTPRIIGRSTEADKDPLYAISSPLVGVATRTRSDFARAELDEAALPEPPAGFVGGAPIDGRTDGRLQGEKASNLIEPAQASPDRILDELRKSFEADRQAKADKSDKVDKDGKSGKGDDNALGRPMIPETPLPPGVEREKQPDNKPGADTRPGAGGKGADGAKPPAGRAGGSGAQSGGGTGAPSFDDRFRALMDNLRTPSAPGISGRVDDSDRTPTTDAERRAAVMREADRLLAANLPTLTSLAPPPSPERDIYGEQMRAGQSLLARDRWFDAEERFSSALRTKQGDTMAQVGRVNAQMGAGLFLSASVNLQELMRSHPELMPVRYDASLLPTGKRLEQVRALLRDEMNRDTPAGRNAALIAAYLGFQAGDAQQAKSAFEALDRIDAALASPRDPLVDALRAVWTREAARQSPDTK